MLNYELINKFIYKIWRPIEQYYDSSVIIGIYFDLMKNSNRNQGGQKNDRRNNRFN